MGALLLLFPCSWKTLSAQLALSGCCLRPGTIIFPADSLLPIREVKEREVTPRAYCMPRWGHHCLGLPHACTEVKVCACLVSYPGPISYPLVLCLPLRRKKPKKRERKKRLGAGNSRLEGEGDSGTTPKSPSPPDPCFPALGVPFPWICQFLCQNRDDLTPSKYICPGVQTRSPPASQISVARVQHILEHCLPLSIERCTRPTLCPGGAPANGGVGPRNKAFRCGVESTVSEAGEGPELMNGFHRETELEFSLEGDRVVHKEEGRKEPLGLEPHITSRMPLAPPGAGLGDKQVWRQGQWRERLMAWSPEELSQGQGDGTGRGPTGSRSVWEVESA